MEDKEKAFGRRTLALIVIIIGWALCSYLVFRYSQIKNHTGSTSDFCKTIFGSSCDKALSSIFAWHLGYPLVFWGFIYFGLLAVLFSLGNWVLDRIVILLAAFGVGISVILTAMLLRGSLTCSLCLGIHFINLLTLIALFLGFRSSITYSQQKPSFVKSPYLKWAFLLLVAVVTGGFSEFGILKSFLPKQPSVNLDEIAKKFQSAKVYNFPKSSSSPHLGSTEAPVQLVIFSSFQCPACKGFAPLLEDVYKKYGKNIGITFKNFPLSTKCSPRLSQDMQPQSCDAALAALAANRQNRFWNYHDQLFESDLSEDEKTLTSIAKNIGLDMQKWEQDRHSGEVQQQLSEDVKAGYETGINATPSAFINGRLVSNLNEKVLNFVIENELKKISH